MLLTVQAVRLLQTGTATLPTAGTCLLPSPLGQHTQARQLYVEMSCG